ncbi:MAG: hypothetical protein ACPGVT_06540 [Maricaulaceae bacterium]
MSDMNRTPALFWVISVIALFWNAMGVAAYIGMTQMTPEMAAEGYGQEFADMFAAKPAWATGAFAIAVFAGLLGSICLLARKTWATALFVISFIGVVVHDIWGVMAGTLSVVGTFDKIMTVAVIVIAVFLIWFARKKTAMGILK